MPATTAIFAQGTLIAKDSGGGVFTTPIAECKTIQGPSMRGELIDVTHQTSPSGFREKLAGLIDGGEVTFEINYVPSNSTHAGLLADFKARARDDYQVQPAGGGGVDWQFLGQVVGFELSAPVDGALTANVTVAVVGEPDFTA